jgi:hypothetical protein
MAQYTQQRTTVKAEITLGRFPGALLFAAADAILVTREPVSVVPLGGWAVAAVAGRVASMPRETWRD